MAQIDPIAEIEILAADMRDGVITPDLLRIAQLALEAVPETGDPFGRQVSRALIEMFRAQSLWQAGCPTSARDSEHGARVEGISRFDRSKGLVILSKR